MRSFYLALCGILAANIIAAQAVAAEDYHKPYVFRPDSVEIKNGVPVLNVAYEWATNMPALYYSVYEAWPASWQAIEDSGIFTAALLSVHGRAIDPDSKLDFAGDIQYIFKGAQTPPVVARLNSGGKVKYLDLADRPAPLPYSQRWKEAPAGYPSPMWKATGLAELGMNRARYQQMAVQSAYLFGARLHLRIHGGYCDWSTLQASGLSPHAPGTINPLTGKPWKGDGSPNDLLFAFSKDGLPNLQASFRRNDGSSFNCLITDEKGNTPWYFG